MVNSILVGLVELEFVKVTQYEAAKEMSEKMVNNYEADKKIKGENIKSYQIQYQTLKMHEDESVAKFFLKLDEVVNTIKCLDDRFEDSMFF